MLNYWKPLLQTLNLSSVTSISSWYDVCMAPSEKILRFWSLWITGECHFRVNIVTAAALNWYLLIFRSSAIVSSHSSMKTARKIQILQLNAPRNGLQHYYTVEPSRDDIFSIEFVIIKLVVFFEAYSLFEHNMPKLKYRLKLRFWRPCKRPCAPWHQHSSLLPQWT